jgi:branched-subunit amino acid aminotransferase/4-amino-4-deoxychorismate lyase
VGTKQEHNTIANGRQELFAIVFPIPVARSHASHHAVQTQSTVNDCLRVPRECDRLRNSAQHRARMQASLKVEAFEIEAFEIEACEIEACEVERDANGAIRG